MRLDKIWSVIRYHQCRKDWDVSFGPQAMETIRTLHDQTLLATVAVTWIRELIVEEELEL